MPSEIPNSVCLAFAQPSKTSDQSVKQASKQASNQARAIKQAASNQASKSQIECKRGPCPSAILRTTIHWLLPLRQIRNPHHACLLASVRLVSNSKCTLARAGRWRQKAECSYIRLHKHAVYKCSYIECTGIHRVDRQTDRQNRQTDRQPDRQTDRQTDMQTD
jgi:hypothetical protein